MTEEPAGLTQLSDGVLGDVAREGEGTGEVRCVGTSVVQPEALMLAHLGGGLPGRLYNAAVQHLGDEGGRRRHCNTTNERHSGSATRAPAGGPLLRTETLVLRASRHRGFSLSLNKEEPTLGCRCATGCVSR